MEHVHRRRAAEGMAAVAVTPGDQPMTIARVFWRWTPFIGRCADPSAPFSRVVHVGCWLIFWGRQ